VNNATNNALYADANTSVYLYYAGALAAYTTADGFRVESGSQGTYGALYIDGATANSSYIFFANATSGTHSRITSLNGGDLWFSTNNGATQALKLTTTDNAIFAGTVTDVSGTLRPFLLGSATSIFNLTSVVSSAFPNWVRRITVNFYGVKTNGSSIPIIQLGYSGVYKTSGYFGVSTTTSTSAGSNFHNTGFRLPGSTWGANATTVYGSVILTKFDGGNTWNATGILGSTNVAATFHIAGSVTLSGALDRVRLIATNGTDMFTTGSLAFSYE